MGLTKWNTETTSKFLSLYREQECLWRNDLQEYRNKDARDTALKSIIADMKLPGLTVDDVKKKIKYLRSTYMVEVNKVEKSIQSGAGTYKPCLSWFHEMDSFIKYVQSKRSPQSIMISQLKSEPLDEEAQEASVENPLKDVGTLDLDIEVFNIKQEDEEQWNDDEQAGQSEESNNAPSVDANKDQFTPPVAKRTRMNRLTSIVQDIKSISKELNKEEQNEFEVFGKYVGLQLKSLPEEDAILAQEEIMSIVTRYKLKKYKRRSTSP